VTSIKTGCFFYSSEARTDLACHVIKPSWRPARVLQPVLTIRSHDKSAPGPKVGLRAKEDWVGHLEDFNVAY
jgi:hypothetical protein